MQSQSVVCCDRRLIYDPQDPAGKTGAETAGVIFIQLDMLQQFQAKQVDGKDQFTVVVDQDFQYGQKSKDGTGRWLAFHNKDHKIYQVCVYASPESAPLSDKTCTFNSIVSFKA